MKQNNLKRNEFEAQAMPHIEELYSTAMYLVENEADAQDLVQGSFVKAYESWDECQFSPDCRVWLFKIMANIIINKCPQSPGPSAAVDSPEEIDGYCVHSRWANQQPIDDSGQVPFSEISVDHIKKAIVTLTDDSRLIVVLSLLRGFSYREIADIMGINLETVRSRLHQGRKFMKRELFSLVKCECINDMPDTRERSKTLGENQHLG